MIGSMRRHAAQGLPIYAILLGLMAITAVLETDFRQVGNLQNLGGMAERILQRYL